MLIILLIQTHNQRLRHLTLTGASFTAPRLAGFTTTSYIGAFDGQNDWTCQWAKFAGGVNTSCNVNTADFADVVPSMQLNPTVTAYNSTLTIELVDETNIKIRVLSMDGRLVNTIANDKVPAGTYAYTIDTEALASGLYFIQVSANNAVRTEKLIVIK